MREFKRGLDAGSIESVQEFLDTRVGKAIRDKKEVQICIRDNYINVYLNGCSILKFTPGKRQKNKYEIHKKYIDNNFSGNKEVYERLELKNGDLVWDDGKKSYIENVLRNPCTQLKKYINKKKKDEKHYISQYLKETKPFLLDLEVAFTRTKDKGKDVADRVDMAIINENMELQLIEVKLDKNSALKAKEDGKQSIIGQMLRYEKFIGDENKNIKSSYRKVAKNYLELNLSSRFPDIGTMSAKEVLDKFSKNGTVAQEPYLLVIGTGKDMIGRYGDHGERLKKEYEGKFIYWDSDNHNP